MTHLILQFVLAIFATCGFCIIFRVPLKHIPACVIVGALSWLCFQVCKYYDYSPVMSCFMSSCLAGLLSDIFSRVFKEAATIFIIPGILCLVPGANIYYTMEEILKYDISAAAAIGTTTLLMAGAIAAGLLIIGAFIKVIRSIIKKTIRMTNRL